MATPINTNELDFRTNNSSHIAPLTSFLSLAPTTSSSYPTLAKIQSAAAPKPSSVDETSAASAEDAVVEPAAEATVTPVTPLVAVTVDESLAHRRSSSMTSDGSVASAKRRFLKLGPVHGGEDTRDADWSEVIE